MLGKTGSFILHTIQLIFAAAVLGLSINAVKWQYYNTVPSTNGYGVFVGGFGCAAALLGFIGATRGLLVGLFVCGFDLMAALFFFAGGIAFAVGLHGTRCSNGMYYGTWLNKLISGGCVWRPAIDRYQCGFFAASDVEYRCRLATADLALLWLGWLACLAASLNALHDHRTRNKHVAEEAVATAAAVAVT